MNKSLSVILPTYNEKDNILSLIDEIESALVSNNIEYEIIVVDDNSPDGTGRIVKERYNSNPRIRVIIRENERGLATAIKTGILNSTGEFILVMDTDFNHDPEKIPLMYKLRDDFDIIIGSRYVAGGGMEGPQFRYWGSYLFNIFIKLILWMGIHDNLSGYLVFNRALIKEIDVEKTFYGYGEYCIRFLFQLKKKKFSIIEIPVIYKSRPSGESKTDFLKYLLVYTWSVLKLRIYGV